MGRTSKYIRRLGMLGLFSVGLSIMGCALRTTRFVPDSKHLLKKNDIKITGEKIDEAELTDVIRQKPNLSVGPIKVRLIVFNSIDSLKTAKGHNRLVTKIRKKNNKRALKEYTINTKRKEKAIAKGESEFIYKKIKLKDSLDVRLTLRERFKYKFGENPVIADTFLLTRSVEQMGAYLRTKGFYFSKVSAYYDTIFKTRRGTKVDKQKVIARYQVETGPRYYIDTVLVRAMNPVIATTFSSSFIKKVSDKVGLNESFNVSINEHKTIHLPFDATKLDRYRNEVAKYFRDKTYYGFVANNVAYSIDTNNTAMTMKLTIDFTDRLVPSKSFADSLESVPHRQTQISGVFFHICDTTLIDNFDQKRSELGLRLKENSFIVTLDTLYFQKLLTKVEDKQQTEIQKKKTYYKSSIYTNLFGKPKDSIAINNLRIATFLYNGELFAHPELIEAQNYLEYTNYYKEYYLDRTYTRLVQLGLFSVIKPEIVENEIGNGQVEIHYYLVPSTKQGYSIEPRANNSNGYLGVTASINYTNKNLIKSGTSMVFSFSGGFESNPTVFNTTDDGSTTNKEARSFNTFEFGPSLKFDIPGLFPIGVSKLGKRARPRTIISGAYNYQKRSDFSRGVVQYNYLYKFFVGKTQIVSFGFPAISVIKFVTIQKDPIFEKRITELNDLFLINAYSNQLIWEDFKISYDYDNLEKDNKTSKLRITFNATFNTAGTVLDFITDKNPKYDSIGHKLFFNVPYSQFSLFDTKFISYLPFTKTKMLAFRSLAGIGLPGNNSSTSLPYDYSFFGGGSNDIRGWSARSLGPGGYQALLDSNRVGTQIGDIRLETSLEYRFGSGGLFNHAFFIDAGNIWTKNVDVNRPGSQFSKSWYKEIAVAVGYGLRLDLSFFIFRIDVGIPISNPALPEGTRWFYQSKADFYTAAEAVYGPDYAKKIPQLYPIQFHFGIGYPF